jgi:hypothetical protein
MFYLIGLWWKCLIFITNLCLLLTCDHFHFVAVHNGTISATFGKDHLHSQIVTFSVGRPQCPKAWCWGSLAPAKSAIDLSWWGRYNFNLHLLRCILIRTEFGSGVMWRDHFETESINLNSRIQNTEFELGSFCSTLIPNICDRTKRIQYREYHMTMTKVIYQKGRPYPFDKWLWGRYLKLMKWCYKSRAKSHPVTLKS